MENHGVLNCYQRSRICRSAAWGGLIGATLTMGVLFFSKQIPPGESSGGLFLAIPWMIALLPTKGVYRLLDWDWKVGSVNEVPMGVFWFSVVVNLAIGALVGGIVGAIIAWVARKSDRTKSDSRT